MTATASPEVFHRDLQNMNDALEALGAVKETSDGWRYIDADLVPAGLLSAYNNLALYGYANGLIP